MFLVLFSYLCKLWALDLWVIILLGEYQGLLCTHYLHTEVYHYQILLKFPVVNYKIANSKIILMYIPFKC